MGNLKFLEDQCSYRTDTELVGFDAANPPVVPVGTTFGFLPRWKNEGVGAVNYRLEAGVSGPAGEVPISYYLDPTIPRSIDPGAIAGFGFSFRIEQVGEYKASMKLFENEVLSDSWDVVVCTGFTSAPPPTEGAVPSGLAALIALGMVGMMGAGLAAATVRTIKKHTKK